MTSATLARCLEIALGGCEVRNVRVMQSTRVVEKRVSHDGCDDGCCCGDGDRSAIGTMRGRASERGRRAFAECALPSSSPSSSSPSPTAAASTSSFRMTSHVGGSTIQDNGVLNIEVRLDAANGDMLGCRAVSTASQGSYTGSIKNGWQHLSNNDVTSDGDSGNEVSPSQPVDAKDTSARLYRGDLPVKNQIHRSPATPSCRALESDVKKKDVVTCVLQVRPLSPTVIGVLRAVVSEHGLGGLYVRLPLINAVVDVVIICFYQ